MSKVALVKGDERYEIILKALNLIKDDIKIGSKNVVIKPNFVSTTKPFAATHVDCVRAILDFLSEFYKKKIIIGEIPAGTKTDDGFRNFDYYQLKDNYDVELIDLDEHEFEKVEVPVGNKTLKLNISKTLIDPNNYVISAAKLKTHDVAVATLSIKNIAVGAIKRGEKGEIHIGIPEINRIMAELAKKVRLDLAVIDGFVGMEGEGPTSGAPVNTKVAIASTDFLAADRVGLEVMGIDPAKVGYLNFCYDYGLGEYDISKITIVGDDIAKCRKKFKLHSTVEAQYKWR